MSERRVMDLRSSAKTLFDKVPGSALQKLRPIICPFDTLVEEVPYGSHVLDVGCGSGLFLGLLVAGGRVKSAIGFDASRSAIARAQIMRRNLSSPGVLEFQRRDVSDGWPEGLFDVISLIDVMHHVPKPYQPSLIQTAAKKLVPGGRLIYKDMVERPIWRASLNRLHDVLLAKDWIHYAPIADVLNWMRHAGLEPGDIRRINMYWYGHELVVAKRPKC